jgi:ATP-dependent Clp protease ATP-binding subunit ClpA
MKKTPRVERTIERAEEIAESYGDDFIGTEDLLLSIVHDHAGVARGVLDELGVLDEVEARLRSVLDSERYQTERQKRRQHAEGHS